MPIRFACTQCQQKLSVSARKAGATANCPRCKTPLVVPGDPAASAEAEFDAPAPPETGFEAPDFDFSQFGGATTTAASPIAPAAEIPVDLDRISLPRWVVYAQGGLLAGVGFICFLLGSLMGGALQSGGSGAAQPVVLSGAVQFERGGNKLPDEGAVIIALPQNVKQADELAPPEGLRPSDPTPAAGSRGLEIIRTVGGGYTRADANGNYQLRLPNRGRYFVVFLSRAQGGLQPGQLEALDSQRIGRFISQPVVLVGSQQYRVLDERLSADRRLDAVFD
jgi:hypothetical protein